jgi:hypothetical protein
MCVCVWAYVCGRSVSVCIWAAVSVPRAGPRDVTDPTTRDLPQIMSSHRSRPEAVPGMSGHVRGGVIERAVPWASHPPAGPPARTCNSLSSGIRPPRHRRRRRRRLFSKAPGGGTGGGGRGPSGEVPGGGKGWGGGGGGGGGGGRRWVGVRVAVWLVESAALGVGVAACLLGHWGLMHSIVPLRSTASPVLCRRVGTCLRAGAGACLVVCSWMPEALRRRIRMRFSSRSLSPSLRTPLPAHFPRHPPPSSFGLSRPPSYPLSPTVPLLAPLGMRDAAIEQVAESKKGVAAPSLSSPHRVC